MVTVMTVVEAMGTAMVVDTEMATVMVMAISAHPARPKKVIANQAVASENPPSAGFLLPGNRALRREAGLRPCENAGLASGFDCGWRGLPDWTSSEMPAI